MRDGVRALLERDAAVERWLREEVVPGHQEYLRDPRRAFRPTRSSGASRHAAPRARNSETLCGLSSRHWPSATSTAYMSIFAGLANISSLSEYSFVPRLSPSATWWTGELPRS